MKSLPPAVSSTASTPSLKKLTFILLAASAATAQASIVANEGFNYSTGQLVSQTSTGTGFTGSWSTVAAPAFSNNSTTAFSVTAGSLVMNGVYSSGEKLSYSRSPDASTGITVAFGAELSATDTLYGSYLFRITKDTFARGQTVAAVMVGGAADNDNAGTFTWAGNGYNNNANNIEGPGVRAEGSSWVVPPLNLTLNTTYVMLFEFNATAKTTSAWVLNEAQLNNFYGSLDSATLNAATANTEAANGVFWKSGAVTSGATFGAMTNLTLIGSGSTQGLNYGFDLDEIRFSNTSLFQSVTAVPEPSTVAFGVALGAFAFGRVLRRRRRNA